MQPGGNYVNHLVSRKYLHLLSVVSDSVNK
jgi:hypothetical protein